MGQAVFWVLAATGNSSARAHNGGFVWQVLWQFSYGFVLVEAILVHVRFAREHIFARLNPGFGPGQVEFILSVHKVFPSLFVNGLNHPGFLAQLESVEIRMFQRLLRRNSLLGVKNHHFLH